MLVERRLLDDPAGVHHHHPVGGLGDHAEVVRDQDHRHCGLVLQVAQQVEDLRLDGDVERGGRLVGDQQLRLAAPAPSRSSRAAACRRRTGADSRRPAARRRGCRPARSSSTARRPRLGLRHVAGARGSPRRSGRRSVNTGLSEVIGSWKTIAMSVAAHRAASRSSGSSSRSCALEHHRSRRSASWARGQPDDRQRRHALAAAGFADDRHARPGRDSKDTPSTARTRRAGAEADPQAATPSSGPLILGRRTQADPGIEVGVERRRRRC